MRQMAEKRKAAAPLKTSARPTKVGNKTFFFSLFLITSLGDWICGANAAFRRNGETAAVAPSRDALDPASSSGAEKEEDAKYAKKQISHFFFLSLFQLHQAALSEETMVVREPLSSAPNDNSNSNSNSSSNNNNSSEPPVKRKVSLFFAFILTADKHLLAMLINTSFD
jgi:hypothetical protein